MLTLNWFNSTNSKYFMHEDLKYISKNAWEDRGKVMPGMLFYRKETRTDK